MSIFRAKMKEAKAFVLLSTDHLLKPLSLLSALIGMLYPFLDQRLGEPHKYRREWSSVMRCVAVFVGINHASAVSFLKLKQKKTNDTDICPAREVFHLVYPFECSYSISQGGHGTGKTGNLVITFSRQGKHREFRYNTGNFQNFPKNELFYSKLPFHRLMYPKFWLIW